MYIATASMFEPLEGGKKGKFSSKTAVFDGSETIESVHRWSQDVASQTGQQVIRVEISKDDRSAHE